MTGHVKVFIYAVVMTGFGNYYVMHNDIIRGCTTAVIFACSKWLCDYCASFDSQLYHEIVSESTHCQHNGTSVIILICSSLLFPVFFGPCHETKQ